MNQCRSYLQFAQIYLNITPELLGSLRFPSLDLSDATLPCPLYLAFFTTLPGCIAEVGFIVSIVAMNDGLVQEPKLSPVSPHPHLLETAWIAMFTRFLDHVGCLLEQLLEVLASFGLRTGLKGDSVFAVLRIRIQLFHVVRGGKILVAYIVRKEICPTVWTTLRDTGRFEFPHASDELDNRVVAFDAVLEFSSNKVLDFGVADPLIIHNDRVVHRGLDRSSIYEIERGQIRVSGTLATDIRNSPIGAEKGNRVGSSGTKGTSGILNHVAGIFSLSASRAAAFLGGGVTGGSSSSDVGEGVRGGLSTIVISESVSEVSLLEGWWR